MSQGIDCIKSSVEGVTQEQAKVITHSNICESNLPIIDSNKQLPEDVCIIQIVSNPDVGLVLNKILRHGIYNSDCEVESILSSGLITSKTSFNQLLGNDVGKE